MQNNNLSNIATTQKEYFLMINNTELENTEQYFQKIDDNKIIIISGLKYSWKKSLIKNYLDQKENGKNFFYFSNSLDTTWTIQDELTLKETIDHHLFNNKNTDFIILENIFNISNIHNLIKYIYSKEQKIILIWNNINIPNVEKIILRNIIKIWNKEDLVNYISYGNLWLQYKDLEENQKRELVNYRKNDILLSEVFIAYSLKNIFLFNLVLLELSKLNQFISQRELLAHIQTLQHTSLKTIIDYIDFSLQSHLLEKMYRYDFKKQKIITSGAKYYFTDIWIRNACNLEDIPTGILKENTVYLKLISQGYHLSGLKNGVFEATFYWQSDQNNILIHIFEWKNNDELKSDIRKILKIWIQKSSQKSIKQFILVNNLEEFHLRKFEYEGVHIIDYDTWLLEK